MISISDIKTVVRVNIPYDNGDMWNLGTRFSEDPTKFTIIFDGNVIPYIPYTEYEWKSPRWHGKQNPNEGWIRTNTVNDLDFMINQASSGESSKIMSAHNRTNLARKRTFHSKEQMVSQGTLTSLKGNKTR